MRITFSPTDKDPIHHEVSAVLFRNDDPTICETLAMVRSVLVAWGYAERTVDKALGEE